MTYLISPLKHGFRSKQSCEAKLISFTQEIFENLEDEKQADLFIMDFSKAFDKVDHNLLIYKLFNLGVILKISILDKVIFFKTEISLIQ